jgi:1-acyl-sn-glycerol-3-phosphate acyltransferase
MASPSTARPERVHPRAWFRLAAIAVAASICFPLHGVWRAFGAASPWPRRFLQFVGKSSGADVTVTGTPVTRDVLYISNHVSWLDIAVLAGKTGSAFVAKADMAPWPVIGWMATLNNSVYVARDQRLDVGAQALAIKTALETGQPLTLFPEGTTANGRELLPFRSALVASVAPPPQGIAIQPVAIDYGAIAPDIAWTDDESVGTNALRVMSRPGRLAVTLHFLEPLDHADFADRKAISAHSRAEIEAALFGGANTASAG